MDERTHPSEVYDTREEALAVAHGRKEIAFRSIHEKEEVCTMSDQLRPGESTGAEIREDDEGDGGQGEGAYLMVGRGLSPGEMVDSVMAWLDEHQGPDDTPPSPPPAPVAPADARPGIAVVHKRASDVLATMASPEV